MGTTLLVYITWVPYVAMISWIIMLTFYTRDLKNKMAGMAVAMAVGMVVGVGVGGSLPILWESSFFSATVIGVVIGGSCGLIAGWSSGLIGMLDGLLSGIMGGMMGAMLGVMVPMEQQHTLIHLLSLFSGGTLFLIFLLIRSEWVGMGGSFGRRYHLPTYFLLLSLFLIGSYAYPFPLDGKVQQGHDQVIQVTVAAEEYTFTPTHIRLEKDKPVAIQLHNKGLEAHGFEWREDGSTTVFRLYAKPGEQVEGMFIPRTTGTFLASCSLPGHKEAGMAIQMQVVD